MSSQEQNNELIPEHQLFAVLGEAGFASIASFFYEKVVADDILGPMYRASPESHHASDMEAHMRSAERRLRDFLIGRFGGPQRYVEQRGHPRLRMRHMPFRIDVDARHRWVHLFSASIDEADLDPAASHALKHYVSQIATFLVNADDPDEPRAVRDLPISR